MVTKIQHALLGAKLWLVRMRADAETKSGGRGGIVFFPHRKLGTSGVWGLG
jgi:hypothetical protein